MEIAQEPPAPEPTAPPAQPELPELVLIPEVEAALPPLIAKAPVDVSVTQDQAFYVHVVSLDDFLIVDDGSEDPTIECTIGSMANSTKAVTTEYSHRAGAYGAFWELPNGAHSVLCTVTDEEGRTATDTHVVTVDVHGSLFPSEAAEQRIKRIARLYERQVIDTDTYHLIIKYYHRADLISFDIVDDRSSGYSSDRQCDVGDWEYRHYYYSNVVGDWANHRGNYDNVRYKQCLERLADDGVFGRLSLGF